MVLVFNSRITFLGYRLDQTPQLNEHVLRLHRTPCVDNLPSILRVILANHMVLNLRSHRQPGGSSILTTKTDIFFREIHSRTRECGEPEAWLDSVLGDNGQPLIVDEVEGEFLAGDDEGELM